MLDWHSCQICYPLEIKLLSLLLLLLYACFPPEFKFKTISISQGHFTVKWNFSKLHKNYTYH